MTWYPIAFLPPQYSSVNGPYSGAVLQAYAAGTSTPILMATDSTGGTTAASFALNAAGYPVSSGNVIIPYLQQNYKLVLYPSAAAQIAQSGAVWTVDNIDIAVPSNTAFLQTFSGDGATTAFTLSSDLGTDEKSVMIFADVPFDSYVTDGTFTSGANWTLGTGWSVAANTATAAGAISVAMSQTSPLALQAGESYTVKFDATQSAGSVTISIGGTAGSARSTSATFSETIIAGATQAISFGTSGFSGTIKNVSIHRVSSTRRQILRSDEFDLDDTSLVFNNAPITGTNNILVFAPSLLFGAVGASVLAAATSETNAAASETAAAASATAAASSATAAAASATSSANSAINSSASAIAAQSAAASVFKDHAAAADPGVGNDVTQGYSVGSVWVNNSTVTGFLCANNSAGAAVWNAFSNITTLADGAVTTAKLAAGAVTEAKMTLADNTTGNVSTSAHGFTPKAPNDATKFLDGTGAYSVPTGGGITALTGGVTASGTGSVAATVVTNANSTGDITSVGNATTLATVNSNVGSYTNASITVNAKGLVTAASTGTSAASLLPRTTQTTTYAPTTTDNASEISFAGAGANATWTIATGATNGSGWYCIFNNPTLYYLTIKVTTNTIDGIAGATGFIMYPGEVRLVQCNGTNYFTTILKGFTLPVLSTLTFSVPPGYLNFDCQAWGAGGGGGANATAGGGGGGGYQQSVITAATMGSTTQTLTIGAGAQGTVGGNTTIGSLLTAYGGGASANSAGSGGGGGGGLTSVGLVSVTTTGGNGGGPAGGLSSSSGVGQPTTSSGLDNCLGGGGGSGGSCAGQGAGAVFGGGGGGSSTAGGLGGNSIYGGAGGGGGAVAGGTSIYGGNGGTGGGAAGSVPGGGGGRNAAGGAGKIIIRGLV